MVLDAFQQRKAGVLAGLIADSGDKSRKGSVDAPVGGLVARINAQPGLYTTSSCSGRITVFGEPTAASRAATGKKGGEWVFGSHDPADPEAVVAAVHARCVSGDRLVLRFEPFILALEANSPMLGQRVLAAARVAGFRESGLTLGSGGRRVMVGVRCSLRLEVPVADGGVVLVPDPYLTYLVRLANEKFQQNLDRIRKFESELFLALAAPAAGTVGVTDQEVRPARAAGDIGAGALAPARRRRGSGGPTARAAGDGGGGPALKALKALKTRQVRVLGRIRALELRLGLPPVPEPGDGRIGFVASELRSDGGRGGSAAAATAAGAAATANFRGAAPTGTKAGAVTAKAAADGKAAVAAAAVSCARTAVAALGCSGGGGGRPLQWRPIDPVSVVQDGLDDAVPRWGHASAVHGDRIYLLGGYGGGGAHARRGDVLVYDTRCRIWDALAINSASAPPPRMGHSAACLGDGYVVLVGGRTSPVDALADVWILDLKRRSWIQVDPVVDPDTTSGAPCGQTAFPGRYRHSAVAVPPTPPPAAAPTKGGGSSRAGARSLDGWRLVLFGGRNASAVLGDTWVLSRDPQAGDDASLADGWRWRQIAAPPGAGAAEAAAPSPRKSHAACWVPAVAAAAISATSSPTAAVEAAVPRSSFSGRMYVHGGTCGYGMHFNDTHYLDLDSLTWHACGPQRGASSSSPPACFSHTLSRWGSLLLLVGGYPTDHHRQLHVLDIRSNTWTALDTEVEVEQRRAAAAAATPPLRAASGGAAASSTVSAAASAPSLDFVPIRHCAEVAGGSLYVMGGGAFCFSFGTVFGGCFELQLGGGGGGGEGGLLQAALQQAVASQQEAMRPQAAPPTARLPPPSPPSSWGPGLLAMPDKALANGPAAGVQDAVQTSETASTAAELKASASSRGASEVRQPARDTTASGAAGGGSLSGDGSGDASSDAVRGWAVSVPSQEAKAVKDALKAAGLLDTRRRSGLAAQSAATGATASSEQQQRVLLAVTDAAEAGLRGAEDGALSELVALMQRRGAELLHTCLAAATKTPSSPAQRLREAVAALLRPRRILAPAGGCTTATTTSSATERAVVDPALVSELLADLPGRWERLGDLALLPAGCCAHPGWESAMAASASSSSPSAASAFDRVTGTGAGGSEGSGAAVMLPLWRAVAGALGVERLARQAPVANTGTRDSRAVLLLGRHGWVSHREGGVTFNLDVTRCMFSSGNVTERTRIGWGRGGLVNAAGGGGGSPGWAAGETVVDLYCGIGYYTLPLLVVAGAAKLYACEWNPHALEALRRNLQQPTLPAAAAAIAAATAAPAAAAVPTAAAAAPVSCRCVVLEGDCRLTAPVGVADRVMLGLLPSSRGGWETAIRALKPESGGWLHLHHNVTDSQESQWLYDTMDELRRLAAAAGRAKWDLRLHHVERVKWYAPHIRHIVMDIECRPVGWGPRPAAVAATAAPPESAPALNLSRPQVPPPPRQVPPPPPPPSSAEPPTAGSSSPLSNPSASAADGGAAGSRWYEQSYDALTRVRRVRGVDSREIFERDISPGRAPVILEGLDLGPAPQLWTPHYLMNLPAAKSTMVSVHVSRQPDGCLDFVHKNFAFRTMTLEELLVRITTAAAAAGAPSSSSVAAPPAYLETPPPPPSGGAVAGGAPTEAGSAAAAAEAAAAAGSGLGSRSWPELVPAGEEYGSGSEVLYLRSIGVNPRREPANLAASFPSLAPDLRLPPLLPPSALHSSVLRISSPGLVLWTHYDVMDNLLIQVRGTKRVLLWPPSCHDALHVAGSSSPITRLRSPDLTAYPRFARCPAPLLADLAPGDVLFLPSLWLHNVTATGPHMSVSVNAFWRHLPQEFYHRKDLYGNRDLVQAEEADRAADQALEQLAALPPHYRRFYASRLLGRLHRALGLEGTGLETENAFSLLERSHLPCL